MFGGGLWGLRDISFRVFLFLLGASVCCLGKVLGRVWVYFLFLGFCRELGVCRGLLDGVCPLFVVGRRHSFFRVVLWGGGVCYEVEDGVGPPLFCVLKVGWCRLGGVDRLGFAS